MPRLLLLEDDAIISRAISTALTHTEGFTVDLADSRAAAVSLLDKHVYDVMVADVMLPDDDGLEILAHLQRSGLYHGPVVVMTARNDTETRERAATLGVAAFVPKPASLDTLVDALTKAQASHAEQPR